MVESPLLELKDLCTYFPIRKGIIKRKVGEIKAVDNISLSVRRGETYGLVGESGCGKSTLGRSVLRLIEPTSGEIFFDGNAISDCSDADMRALRKKMQIVFQDPYASLNPRMTIGDIVTEPLRIHEPLLSAEERRRRATQTLQIVGIDKEALSRYPHEFSGGQRQRISIARVLVLNPEFIFFDEPVSALDVSVRSQVLNLIVELQKTLGLTYLFISHDLSVVRHISHRVSVMYLGSLVETASKEQLFSNPCHPYTRCLMSAIPNPDPDNITKSILLTGDVPSPADPPRGCRFHTRCPNATEWCRALIAPPPDVEVEPGHFVSCILYQPKGSHHE